MYFIGLIFWTLMKYCRAKSLWPGNAIWEPTTWPSLVQVINGSVPVWCWLTVIWTLKIKPYHNAKFQIKMHLKMLYAKCLPFCSMALLLALRLRQNGHHFADDRLKCIFFNENVSISINISLKFDPKGPNNNIPALVQIMAWHRPGDKPLSELKMVSFQTQKWITWPQWVNSVDK